MIKMSDEKTTAPRKWFLIEKQKCTSHLLTSLAQTISFQVYVHSKQIEKLIGLFHFHWQCFVVRGVSIFWRSAIILQLHAVSHERICIYFVNIWMENRNQKSYSPEKIGTHRHPKMINTLSQSTHLNSVVNSENYHHRLSFEVKQFAPFSLPIFPSRICNL